MLRHNADEMECSSAAVAAARIRLMRQSYAYASPGLCSRACRHAVTLLLATGRPPVQVKWRHGRASARALLVAPLVDRHLCAAETPLVLVDLEPRHPQYRRLARAAAPAGVLPLPEPQAQALIGVAQGFHAGGLGGPALDARLADELAALAAHWPDPGPPDPRVDWMMRTLDRDPCITLERLAQALGLSPTRASRLFSAHAGIPCRAYALAAKIHAAARWMGRGLSLTDVALAAGFADSAHFAKVWLRCYGAPPSAYFAPRRTAVDAVGQPAPAVRPLHPAWAAPPA